jgi:hypothetical protein
MVRIGRALVLLKLVLLKLDSERTGYTIFATKS